MENGQIKKITAVFLLNVSDENAKSTSQEYSRVFHLSVEFPNVLYGGTAPVLLWQLLPNYNKELGFPIVYMVLNTYTFL